MTSKISTKRLPTCGSPMRPMATRRGEADESAASFDDDFEHDIELEEDLMQDEDDFEDGDDVDADT